MLYKQRIEEVWEVMTAGALRSGRAARQQTCRFGGWRPDRPRGDQTRRAIGKAMAARLTAAEVLLAVVGVGALLPSGSGEEGAATLVGRERHSRERCGG